MGRTDPGWKVKQFPHATSSLGRLYLASLSLCFSLCQSLHCLCFCCCVYLEFKSRCSLRLLEDASISPVILHCCSISVDVSFSSTSASEDGCNPAARHSYLLRRRHSDPLLSDSSSPLQANRGCVHLCASYVRVYMPFTGWADACQEYYVDISANKILISSDKK